MGFRERKTDKKLIARLTASIKNGSLSHAYIIEGPASADKMQFAKDFLKAATCKVEPGLGCGGCPECHKIDHDNEEDLYLVQDTSTTGTIKVKAIEELISKIQKRPLGNLNMVIIEDADLMNEASQNKLLKTLEEPPGQALILLLSENPDMLKDTIRSRCVELKLSEPSPDDIGRDALVSELVSALLEKDKFFYLKQRLGKLVKSKDEALDVLDNMELIYRDCLLGKDERGRLMKAENIFAYVELIEETRRDISGSVGAKYVQTIMKNLILKISMR